ncbi:MAG: diphthamide synthesis protein [Nanoarchaeota archaeon]
MKVLFVEAKNKLQEDEFNISEFKELPEQLHILYTIQYKSLADLIKKQLEKTHEIVCFEQILGCSKIELKASPLLISTGNFHALQLALSTDRTVYIYEQGKLRTIGKEEIRKLQAREKGKITRFLFSENIGLIFSAKPGQRKTMAEIEEIKKHLKARFPEKSFYAFISDAVNFSELENFQIDFWLNFACPGLSLDSDRILNYERILDIEK